MDGKEEWEGTATELLEALSELPSVNEKDKAWPKRPNTLTRRLNNLKSALADYGIKVQTAEDYRTATQKTILLRRVENLSSLSSYRHKSSNIKALGNDDIMTISDDNGKISSFLEPLKNLACDANDANDAIFPTFQKSNKPDWEVWET
jgi:hypothetical protein